MTPPIRFDRVSHWYGDRRVLHDVTFDVPEGSVFALLGRNGAGKSTSIRCLLGFETPTRGTASLLGHDARDLPPSVRGDVAYVAEDQHLVRWMTGAQLQAFHSATFPRFDTALFLDRVHRLRLPLDQRVRTFSRGQRAQLALALAVATHPRVVVLDDPALGLDTAVRREFLDVVIDLIQQTGNTVLFSSHLLGDVDRVADRIAILHHGALRVLGPLDAVKDAFRRVSAWFDDAAPTTLDVDGVFDVEPRGRELRLCVVGDVDRVLLHLEAMGGRRLTHGPLMLEDLFLAVTRQDVASPEPAR